jgi:acetoin utilization protein AcuB
MKVKQWMTPNPITISADEPILSAVSTLLKHRIRHLIIVDDGVLVGIVSERDIKRALPSLAAGTSPKQYQRFMTSTRVEEVMTRQVTTCVPETDMIEAARHFCSEKIGSLPVLENGQVVGILTQTDAMRAYLEELERQAE